MALVDWLAIGVFVLAAALGALCGFGKLLKFFTGGFIGFIISIVVTYFLLGVVCDWGFVKDLLVVFRGLVPEGENNFYDLLLKIGFERIVFGIVLFIVVTILRIIIVRIIKRVVETDVLVLKIINKTCGAIFLFGVLFMLMLVTFSIIAFVGGDTAADAFEFLIGELRLHELYINNPLNSLLPW